MAQRFADQGRADDAALLAGFVLERAPEHVPANILRARLRADRGDHEAAVDDLVEVARRLGGPERAEHAEPADVYAMFALALELTPERLELHVDLAEVQARFGDIPGAQARLVQLSAVYIDAGQPDDARAVLAVAGEWDPQSSIAGVIEAAIPIEESVPILLEDLEDFEPEQPAPVPRRVPRAATICTPTLLRDAGGQVLPNQAAIPKPPLDRGRPRRRAEPIPAPPTDPSLAQSSAAPGHRRTLPGSRTSIRTLRARAHVRTEASAGAADTPLASRLRKLSRLPK